MADVLANYVKFLRGTPTAYNNLAQKDSDTLYFVAEKDATTGKLYLGEVLISGSLNEEGVAKYLSELSDVDTSGAVQNSILGFDSAAQKWVVMDVNDLVNVSLMSGATAEADGASGLVPAPAVGQEDYYLSGDGTWKPLEIPEVSKTQVFEAEVVISADETTGEEVSRETHEAAIARVVGEKVPVVGDIAIVKELIANDKYQHTAYIHNGSAWTAMDGNYNAANVYFDEDFVFTKAIGTVTIPSSGSTTVAAEGKSVKQFFASLFAAESEPSVTKPSVSSLVLSKAGDYEAGTVLTGLTYSCSFEDGKYQYGPEPTGSTVSAWNVTDNAGNAVGTTASGDVADLTVTGDTNYYLNATATYTDGVYAKTNLGNTSTTKYIKGATTATKPSSAITGYWKYFYEVIDTSVKGDIAGNITSDFIRGLANSAKYAAGDIEFGAHSGAKALVFACPASKAGITAAIMPSALQSPIPWVDGSPFTVSVEGVTDAVSTNYNVWIYEPAAIDATETYKITLG